MSANVDGEGKEQMRVRFLVNKTNARILYMEAGKDLVDLLLAFLQLPIATILSMFSPPDNGTSTLKVGCISNIYESLQKVSSASLVVKKEALLHPPSTFEVSKTSPQLLLPAKSDTMPPLPATVFRCGYCSRLDYVSWVSGETCPSCAGQYMNAPMSLTGTLPPAWVPPSTTPAEQGYVKHYLSFIVTNDLTILPASTIESIVLLGKLNVEKVSDLDSFESYVTADEALGLLKTSLTSKEALNNVFGAKVSGCLKKVSPKLPI